MSERVYSHGHSSQVRGWLVLDGIRHELAQVGPDFCITRKPIATTALSPAELIIEVDGDQRVSTVRLKDKSLAATKRIEFSSE